MSETLESLRRKIESAGDLGSVVRTMKATAASNITQYVMAVNSLSDYYRSVSLGLFACFNQERIEIVPTQPKREKEKQILAVAFGSDIGLVGGFNDRLAEFIAKSLHAMTGAKEIWVVGERIRLRLIDAGFVTTKLFAVPNSVSAITPLVGQILIESERKNEKEESDEFYIFHNCPEKSGGYKQVSQRLFPLDEEWKHGMSLLTWPTNKQPQVIGEVNSALSALIREYLFVSLFRACAESMASENEGRLEAMQRAEKNIEDLLEDLNHDFNRLRQDSIDEELFDVIAGFEALQKIKG
jgi:F-type H+-transporting ATPase subunit gamma